MENSNFADIRTAVIQDIIHLAREKYVYPEMGEKIASQIQSKLEAGDYDAVANESELAFHPYRSPKRHPQRLPRV